MTIALEETTELSRRVLDQVERVVVGKRDVLQTMLMGILAGGHILIEDLPGLGKTMIAKCFAQSLGLDFTRVQFTPDLLPSDLTGSAILDPRREQLVFQPGPVFTNVLLADEINRTPPKTQAALLEAMSEASVSVDGVTHRLPGPFIVLATDNPIEYEGTYPLPEAQLDRFMLRVRVGYLAAPGEHAMVRERLTRGTAAIPELEPVVDVGTVLSMMAALEVVEVADDVIDYVVRIVAATRDHRDTLVGASPRGTLAMIQLARARALLAGRPYVVPQDAKAVAVPALAHRLSVRPELWVRRIGGEEIVTQVLERVATPPTVREPDLP